MISKNTISGLCRFLFPSVYLYVCLAVMRHNSFRLSKRLFSSSPCTLIQLCLQTRGLPHQTNRQKTGNIQTSIYFSVCWFLVTFFTRACSQCLEEIRDMRRLTFTTTILDSQNVHRREMVRRLLIYISGTLMPLPGVPYSLPLREVYGARIMESETVLLEKKNGL